MILVLIDPRIAGLPFSHWLPEERGRMVAVTAAGVAVGDGFTEVVTVADYADDDTVLNAARDAARRHRPRAILALAEGDVERAALLRVEFGLPGLDRFTATAYRDKAVMTRYARAAGIRVAESAPVTSAGEIAEFMSRHPGRVVVKPRSGSGSAGGYVLDTPAQAADLAGVVSAQPYVVEVFVDGVRHRVDAIRVDRIPVAAVASVDTADPMNDRLVYETWRLVNALPSPRTISVHAEFFVTAADEIVLCEVAARIDGGPITKMLHQVMGIDPRHLWARLECGLPVDLDAVRKRVRTLNSTAALVSADFGRELAELRS